MSKTKYKLEYIWLDGTTPVPDLRGKTLLKEFDNPPTLADLPNWGFDGSSTGQAEGKSSDCVLKPVALYPDGARNNGYVVLSEVLHADLTPTPQMRVQPSKTILTFGLALSRNISSIKTGGLLGFQRMVIPTTPQGPYYCGVGYKHMGNLARKIVEEHLELCLTAGINHEGINAEVAKGQWEFQIFAKGSTKSRR